MPTEVETQQVEQMVRTLRSQDMLTVVECLLILALGFILSRLIQNAIAKMLEKSERIDPLLKPILRTSFRVVWDLAVILLVAGVLGFQMTSIVAILSVVGLAVSLSIQGILSNLAGGVIVLMSKPFSVGDFIETDGVTGTVQGISFMHTRLATVDSRSVLVPNGQIANAKLINYSNVPSRRITLPISISYDIAPEAVREAALEALENVKKKMSYALETPVPQVNLVSYGDSGINYELWVWCKPANYLTLMYALNEEIYTVFRQRGVEITYPHVNVHMVK